MVGLQGVSDNFRGKTVTLVAGCLLFHAAQSAKPQLNCQYRLEAIMVITDDRILSMA